MIPSNLHTHSVFSDGKNTVEEIADAAVQKGFRTLGMSDHSYTAFDPTFCMKDGVFDRYVEKVNECKAKYAGTLDIFCGMELDYYSENIPTDRLDYIIGSVHYVKRGGVYYGVDHSAEGEKQGIDEGCGGDVHLYIREYYRNICDHIAKNPVNVVGHFDVLTKFGLIDEEDPAYRREALAAADYAIERGVIIEINTGAVFKKLKKNPYPNAFILKHICEKGGRVCIDSDSHIIDSLDFYFEESCALMKACGFRTAAMLTKDGFCDVEL